MVMDTVDAAWFSCSLNDVLAAECIRKDSTSGHNLPQNKTAALRIGAYSMVILEKETHRSYFLTVREVCLTLVSINKVTRTEFCKLGVLDKDST